MKPPDWRMEKSTTEPIDGQRDFVFSPKRDSYLVSTVTSLATDNKDIKATLKLGDSYQVMTNEDSGGWHAGRAPWAPVKAGCSEPDSARLHKRGMIRGASARHTPLSACPAVFGRLRGMGRADSFD